MKIYQSLNEAKQWGFNPLTGEACGLNLRILFDLSEQGHELLARSMGFNKEQLILSPSWNGGEFSAGSALLTTNQIETCVLLGMLLHDKCLEVWTPIGEYAAHGFLYGIDSMEELAAAKETNIEFSSDVGFRAYKLSGMPGTGDRNRHAMSGRIQ
mgnify:CR=1 FL=1